MTTLPPKNAIRVNWVKRGAYLIVFLSMLFIALTLLIGSIRSVQSDRVWDPYTGERYVNISQASCVLEAERLIRGPASSRQSVWSKGLSDWTTRCQFHAPHVHQIMIAVDEKIPRENTLVNAEKP